MMAAGTEMAQATLCYFGSIPLVRYSIHLSFSRQNHGTTFDCALVTQKLSLGPLHSLTKLTLLALCRFPSFFILPVEVAVAIEKSKR